MWNNTTSLEYFSGETRRLEKEHHSYPNCHNTPAKYLPGVLGLCYGKALGLFQKRFISPFLARMTKRSFSDTRCRSWWGSLRENSMKMCPSPIVRPQELSSWLCESTPSLQQFLQNIIYISHQFLAGSFCSRKSDLSYDSLDSWVSLGFEWWHALQPQSSNGPQKWLIFSLASFVW